MASLGDSVCTLVGKDRQLTKLSFEHTPQRADEEKRIKSCHGNIIKGKVQGDLAVTRAIGNIEHKSIIIPEPETKSQLLTSNDDFLILSTDGLFRVYSQDHVAKRVLALRAAGYNLAQISEKIIEECLEPEKGKRAANDNITLIIVDLAAYYTDRSTP